MERSENRPYRSLKAKPHEVNLQELRHERRTEEVRLDGLKKTLQNKMQGEKKGEKIRAA